MGFARPRDTEPDAHRVHIALMRNAPGWRKLQLAGELHRTVRAMVLAGLRQRYPAAAPEELQRRLADLLLGPVLAEKAYGPLPDAR